MSRRHFVRLVVAGASAACIPVTVPVSPGGEDTDGRPVIIGDSPQNEANPVRLPDGALRIYYMERNRHVAFIRSADNGLTWSAPEVAFQVSGETGYACRSLVDVNGRVHVWFVQRGAENARLPGKRDLDIWYNHTTGGQDAWARPWLVWRGYCGAIRSALQMANSRIVVPFGAWKQGDEKLPENTGSNYVTVIFSDDGGSSWVQSDAMLTSPVHAGYNGNNYGACEPGIIERADGTLWMLMRTQTGFLYESFSRDGISWTPANPSRFSSSNSPAGFVDLPGDRMVVLWNNHELPPRSEGQGVYGGRDALHAAISDDGGKTWRGFREVYLDPSRNESPPARGDRGTGYPNGAHTDDGHILLTTGQGQRSRKIIRFCPDWLCETRRQHDFTTCGLQEWCVYKSIGPARNWWRDRKQGAQLISNPDHPKARVLHVRRPDQYAPDGATWNFPAGEKGTLTLRLRLNAGFGGAQISLADRLFDPSDDQGERLSVFQLQLHPDYLLDGRTKLAPDSWYTLAINWDVRKERCEVTINNSPALTLPQSHPTVNGVSYLRLRSKAPAIDHAGILVERVKVVVRPS